MATRKSNKKKGKKKKRISQAWKGLEKHVASYLKGTRILRGANFSASLPDVVVDMQQYGIPNLTLVVECKHSKNQPFVTLLKDELDKYKIVSIEDGKDEYVFCKLTDAVEVMFKSGNHLMNIKRFLKEIPKYIRENFKQAEGYHLQGLHNPLNDVIRMVVIAKKGSSSRIIYTKSDQLQMLCDIV